VETGSDFWRFSLAIYRMDGVPPACLALQDGHGLDVNLMLFALWLASQGRALSPDDISDADSAVMEWRSEAVVALRRVRRYLRSPPDAFDAKATSALRDRIKAVELEAERLQQEALFALRPVSSWGRVELPEPAGAFNMEACAGCLGATFDPGPRDAILNAYRTLIARGVS
jgi:uncharacterized protein (TIGR02444 family)